MTPFLVLAVLLLAVAAHVRALGLLRWQRAVLGALRGAVYSGEPPRDLRDPEEARRFVEDVVATGALNRQNVLTLVEMTRLPPPGPRFVDGRAVLDAIVERAGTLRALT